MERRRRPSSTQHADEGTGEYNAVFSIWGIDRQYAQLLENGARQRDRRSRSKSYGVGAKAGEKLRDDAAKSIIYAIFLIMLYLAFRFDIRYAPGAAFATIHDAVMVIGVFAMTWTEVSLTSVAGLLTVIGYSVNDTVIVFDRIRENQAKLKDKKLERIIDISINEMLVRTILTSSTVFATTLIMNIFGTGLVKNFAFAMNIGVIVGTYSSIFLAAPIFMWISKKWYSGPAKARRRPAPVSALPSPDTPSEPDEEVTRRLITAGALPRATGRTMGPLAVAGRCGAAPPEPSPLPARARARARSIAALTSASRHVRPQRLVALEATAGTGSPAGGRCRGRGRAARPPSPDPEAGDEARHRIRRHGRWATTRNTSRIASPAMRNSSGREG